MHTLTEAEYATLREAAEDRARLLQLINSPQTALFLSAVQIEIAHQAERWGRPSDQAKGPEKWFWLVGYLAGKALRAAITGDEEKALHHCVSSAAVLGNWFAAIKAGGKG